MNLKVVKKFSIFILLSMLLAACEIGSSTAYNKANNSTAPVTPCVITGTPIVTGAITLSAAPSRLSGVAPLSVFFDATCTTATTTPRPFHELEYTWSFGDSGVSAGNWTQGSALGSKNAAKGPVAAHIFETPGTYTVTLAVIDGTNSGSSSSATTNFQIVVQDPDVVFAGKTRCFHNSSAIGSGVCAGLEVMTSGNAGTDVANALAAGMTRILFKRGDTFSTSSWLLVTGTGPGIIGAYGSGAVPIINSTSSVNGDSVIRVNIASDWRIMDLSLTRSAVVDLQAINIANVVSDTTILRVTTDHFVSGIIASPGTDRLTIQDSSVGQYYSPLAASGEDIYIIGTSQAVMGCYINMNTPSGSHGLRTDGTIGLVISNNTFPSFPGISYRGNSQYGVVSDNMIISTVPGVFKGGNIGINPANNQANESQKDIIVERNMMVRGSVHMGGNGITVRNNVFYSDVTGIFFATGSNYTNTAGAPRPDNLYVYNNSIYTLDSAASDYMIYNATGGVDSTTHVTVKNNVAYAPSSTTPVAVGGTGSPVITASNNTTNAQINGTNPLFTNGSGLFNTPLDFKPAAISYAIGSNNACSGSPCATSSVPLWADFFGASRTSPYDMGAVNK